MKEIFADTAINEMGETISGKGFSEFADLVNVLGASTKTNDKTDALKNYFLKANDKDKVWVIAIFSGRRPKRAVSTSQLHEWCMKLANIPRWLFDECYHTVGDLAETIALLTDSAEIHTVSDKHAGDLYSVIEGLIEIEKTHNEVKEQFILSYWKQMTTMERFVFNKIITGGFRIGVSQNLMVQALSKTVDLPASVIAHRISGNWDPVSIRFSELMEEDANRIDHSKPYPFYLSYALESSLQELGNETEWQAEWKWDGIRGQLIKRNHELYVWSRGEELITEKFPEYQVLKNSLPDGVVVDGEIICIDKESNNIKPLTFALLQTRISRKNVTKKQLSEAPVGFIAYDLLEYNYQDMRNEPLERRRELLEKIISDINNKTLRISPLVIFDSWDDLEAIRSFSRDNGAEGLMLKRLSSVYQSGRRSGDWWKWKIEPLTIDAVMIYAQKGHGRRSNLYTDYTFAVKDGDKLVPFTKAYSGLTDKEFAEVDAFVKRNSIEKFGPVRTVQPKLVFEIAFEGITASNRHKSGVALRFPRIKRWRKDKLPEEINTMEDLKGMLEVYGK